MPTAAPTLVALQRLLDGSVLLGAEIDLAYRVLAITIETPFEASPTLPTVAGDNRIQVLLSPASTILACLRTDGPDVVIESFDVEQLPDIVAALDGPVLEGQMVGRAAPGPPVWPVPSMAGRSSAPDGHAHRVLLEVHGRGRRLGLFATFDEVEIRTPDGVAVDLR